MSKVNANKTAVIFKLTLLSLFIAIMLVMNFTPIGYITTGLFSITLMTIPVALGGACTGPAGGTVLGAVFGLTSFLQAFGIGFMIDPMAANLFTENPFGYTVTCFLPRLIVGFSSGFVFWLFKRSDKVGIPAFMISAAIVPLLNTILFMTFYALFYRNTVLGGTSVMAVVFSAFTINFVIELIVTLVAGTFINKAIYHYAKRYMN